MAETLMFDYHRQHGIGKLQDSYLHCLIFKRVIDVSNMCVESFMYLCLFTIEIRVARIFNTYGPRMNIDDGRVVSNFIAQAVR